MKTRLFWVVDSPEDNEEIFEAQEDAKKYAEKYGKQSPYRIYIAEVRNYFQEANGAWNYEDHSDTFNTIITITMQTDTRVKTV
jgi:hypothetical protein